MIAMDAIDSGSSSSAPLVIDAFRIVLSISASETEALPSTVPVAGDAGDSTVLAAAAVAAPLNSSAAWCTEPVAVVPSPSAAARRPRNSTSAGPRVPSDSQTPTAIS